MIAVGTGLAVHAAALVALLAVLRTTVGLSVTACGAGLACAVALAMVVMRGLGRRGAVALGPADLVTLTRSTLACAVAALVADSGGHRSPSAALAVLVLLAALALVLDAVDGRVARRTRSASAFGAWFDGEADAFLILVLSVYVAASVGGWVLLIGAARYLFGAGGWVFPWLQEPLPPRTWRKAVAAIQGIVLTVAAADVTPEAPTYASLVIALVLLAESFGRDSLWLWRHRAAEPATGSGSAGGVRLRSP